jgi:hypothetical protein
MHSRLGLRILRLFALGILAGTDAQLLAMEGWADGRAVHDDELIKRLAKAGTCGRRTGNITRDILKAAELSGLLIQLAQPYFFDIPGPGGKTVQIAAMLPHEVYYKLVSKYGADNYVIGEDRKDDPVGIASLVRQWTQHPDVVVQHQVQDIAAIGLHADGVQYTNSVRAGSSKKNIYVGGFNIISGRRIQDRSQRYLFFALSKGKLCDCGCGGYHSFQAVFDVWSWSMRMLMLGKTLCCRHDGKEWSSWDAGARIEPDVDLPVAALC